MNTKSSRTKFAFIIPTLSNRDGLVAVLGDIQREYSNAHVIIVNNDTIPIINIDASSSLQIITLDQNRNTGFAKACNDGAKAAREHFGPEHLIFLNDDIRFTSDWVEECLKTMEHKKWFATTPLLKKPDGSLENIGYKVLPQGKIKLALHDSRSTIHESVDGLTAAALAIKTDDFFSLKGFDERFFAYLEDVDLFMTAKEKGKKFGTTTNVFVVHHGQVTSSSMKTRKAWLDTKNWYLLLSKHWTREMLAKHFGSIVAERLRNISGLIKSLI